MSLMMYSASSYGVRGLDRTVRHREVSLPLRCSVTFIRPRCCRASMKSSSSCSGNSVSAGYSVVTIFSSGKNSIVMHSASYFILCPTILIFICCFCSL